MLPESAITKPALVYKRIAHNRIKTVALVALAVGLILPFVAAVSFGVSEFLLAQFGPRPDFHRSYEQSLRETVDKHRKSTARETAFETELYREMEARSTALHQQRARNIGKFSA